MLAVGSYLTVCDGQYAAVVGEDCSICSVKIRLVSVSLSGFGYCGITDGRASAAYQEGLLAIRCTFVGFAVFSNIR